ncbi:MAG: thioredoxin family protein [Planctomycetota bacterium]
MRTLSALLLVALCVGTARADEGQPLSWVTSLAEGQKLAKEQKKPILIDFTGSDWCGWCKRLKAEVFDHGPFQAYATKRLVMVELDFPRQVQQSEETKKTNRGLAQKYGVKGFPTILLVDHTGAEIGRTGYQRGGPEKYVEHLKALLAKGYDAEKNLAKPKPEGDWKVRWEEATAEAKKTGKPILADFTGSDWCGWCIKLKDEVFATEEFVAWAKQNVILLELDFPARKPLPKELKEQNERLQKQYKIEGYPTILFLDADGKVLAQSGYLPGGPKAWIAAAEKDLGAHLKKSSK